MNQIMLGGIFDDLKARWDAAVSGFQAKEREFLAAGEDLTANRDRYYAAGLGARYEQLVQRGRFIQSTVTATADKIGAIYDWFKNAVGLGIAPITIPFAALAGAVAVIGSFLLAYQALKNALIEYEIRQLPPEQQAQARRDLIASTQQSTTGDISSIVWGVAAIGLIVLFLPQLMKQKGR